jgi:Uma2 family endonuclease
MSMPATDYFTADDVRALPDDRNRYETVHGDLLVTPAPGGLHQRVLDRLQFVIANYLALHHIEDLVRSPADLSWGSADTLVQPDLFVADCSAFNQSFRWDDIRDVHLVVEVVSPSSAVSDRGAKRRLYQEHAVSQYWVIDNDQRHVEIWTPHALFPVIERERLVWRHPAITDDCVVELARIFPSG